MVTLSPATGTLRFGQVAGSDQCVGLAAGDPAFLGLNDSEHADEQECWNERSKKERAMLLTHGINPRTRR